jgi:hypothetical protein
MNDLMEAVMTFEVYFFYLVITLMPVYALISIVNRLRIKSVQLSLRHGLLWGYPLLPTIYGVVQLGCIGIALMIGDEGPLTKFSFYFLASLFWFVGSVASEQKLVIEDGIILSVNNSQKKSLLAWDTINDYFVKPKKYYTEYHFFYEGQNQNKHLKCPGKCKVVIRVQQQHKAKFDNIIKNKLDPRFEIDPAKVFRGEYKP